MPPAHLRSKAELKEVALQRQLKVLKLKVGNKVKIKGSNKIGEVIEIQIDPEKMDWRGVQPRFIKIEYRGIVQFFSPSQLKRVDV